MRRLSLYLVLGALCASQAGCAPDIAQLANDKNADCVVETSVWVNLKFDRNWGCEYPPPGFILVPGAPAAK